MLSLLAGAGAAHPLRRTSADDARRTSGAAHNSGFASDGPQRGADSIVPVGAVAEFSGWRDSVCVCECGEDGVGSDLGSPLVESAIDVQIGVGVFGGS